MEVFTWWATGTCRNSGIMNNKTEKLEFLCNKVMSTCPGKD